MFTVYRAYIANGKDAIAASKMIVLGFTSALQKWKTRTMTMNKWNLWKQTKIKTIEGIEESILIGCMTDEIIKYLRGASENVKAKNT